MGGGGGGATQDEGYRVKYIPLTERVPKGKGLYLTVNFQLNRNTARIYFHELI